MLPVCFLHRMKLDLYATKNWWLGPFLILLISLVDILT